jgi:hypothetical protein
MKKLLLLALPALFISSILCSCSKPAHCQAYSKVVKVKADKTEKSI